jgi:nucleoside-diphosphate-sugar epimerase
LREGQGVRVFVTGGSGFLGRRIAELLLEEGREVTAYARRPLPELEKLGARTVTGEFRDKEKLLGALRGCGAAVHAAAKTDVWGRLSDYLESNTASTELVLQAAREAGAGAFVFTSSPAVVHHGESLERADESAPYMEDKRFGYPYSKMLAEKLVLGANSESFRTLALRPHLVWGPRDPHFLPRIFRLAERGRLRFFSGGPYLVSHTYIDNAARAHLVALERLAGAAEASGLSYFVAQPEPMEIKALVNRLLECGGRPPVNKTVPKWLGRAAGAVCGFLWGALPLPGEPPLTRFSAAQLSTSHTLDVSRAERVLGWRAEIGTEEGFQSLAQHLREHPIV